MIFESAWNQHYLALGMLLSTIASLVLLRLVVGAGADMSQLRKAVTSVLRGVPLSAKNHFTFRQADELWHLIKTVGFERVRGINEANNLVHAWKSSAPQADGFLTDEQASLALLESICCQLDPEVVAAAFVRRSAVCGRLQITAFYGPYQRRLSEPILAQCERLRDGCQASSAMPTILTDEFAQGHLSMFGLNSAVVIHPKVGPADDSCIWLGLRISGSCVDGVRLQMLEAMAAHGGAFLKAAGEAGRRLNEERFDRDIILGMSHDLKAPGNSAIYALEALLGKSTSSDPQEREMHLRIIDHAVREQHRLVCDLLDFAKHRHGSLSVERVDVDVQALIEDVLFREQIALEARAIETQVEVDSGLFVLAERSHLARVLSNLVANSIKYGDTGLVRIEARRVLGKVEVSVSDSGPGVPQSELNDLFTPFKRLSSSGGVQGTGLGLAVSKVLVEANGGQLTYDTSHLGGAKFTITLDPANRESEPEPGRLDISALIIDDDSSARRVLRRYLTGLVSEVEEAETTAEALKICQSLKPNLIVSDLHLCGSNATSFLENIEDDVSVIVVSGQSRDDLPESIRRLRNARYLEKPFSRDALVRAVRSSQCGRLDKLHAAP